MDPGRPDVLDGLPAMSGAEVTVEAAIAARRRPAAGAGSFEGCDATFAIALHYHQPLVPAGGDHLPMAAIIGNLQWMFEHPEVGDNHDAPAFLWCYERMAHLVPELVEAGYEPRVMLDYSGTLLHGLRVQGAHHVLDALTRLANHTAYGEKVEWLGSAWGHPVAPSTPVADFRRHVRAWQHHVGSLFGLDVLGRIRGFSPAELALPNHPDVAHAFVRTLVECGYEWVLVQEHTIEELDGGPVGRPHLPHRLVATSSAGDTAEIVAVVKTQGSDTKLVGQMQPYAEARTLGPVVLAGRTVPPLVTQIADGENGGVMMNEFPDAYRRAVREATGSRTRPVNASEYLDALWATGVGPGDLDVVRPRHQAAIWRRLQPGDGPERLAGVIDELRREDPRFHVDGGSWTDDRSWVRGYDDVLAPMERASALFAERVDGSGVPTTDPRYRNALFHLLTAETSCYRYWGHGRWTDYGAEVARRAADIARYDFPDPHERAGGLDAVPAP